MAHAIDGRIPPLAVLDVGGRRDVHAVAQMENWPCLKSKALIAPNSLEGTFMHKHFPGVLVAVALLGLSACGPKGDFEKAINAEIGVPMCLAYTNMEKIQFPIRAEISTQDMAVYEALQKDGDITVAEAFGQGFASSYEINVTSKGKAAGVWSKEGFCYGRKQVNEIVRYQEKDGAAQVEYTYRIIDAPAWAKAGLDIEGLKEPASATAALAKYSDGWKFVAGM